MIWLRQGPIPFARSFLSTEHIRPEKRRYARTWTFWKKYVFVKYVDSPLYTHSSVAWSSPLRPLLSSHQTWIFHPFHPVAPSISEWTPSVVALGWPCPSWFRTAAASSSSPLGWHPGVSCSSCSHRRTSQGDPSWTYRLPSFRFLRCLSCKSKSCSSSALSWPSPLQDLFCGFKTIYQPFSS